MKLISLHITKALIRGNMSEICNNATARGNSEQTFLIPRPPVKSPPFTASLMSSLIFPSVSPAGGGGASGVRGEVQFLLINSHLICSKSRASVRFRPLVRQRRAIGPLSEANPLTSRFGSPEVRQEKAERLPHGMTSTGRQV